MARNLRPGPKWVPGVIVQRLGPLSFLIKTRDGQMWRRHVDHLKEVRTDPEPESKDKNSRPDDDDWELPSSGHSHTHASGTADTEHSTSSESTRPDPENDEADELPNTEADEAASGETSRRYPVRDRHPPEYYQ